MHGDIIKSEEEYKIDEEYRVSELAKLLDLTPETIRYYESVGIIKPRHDEGNRYRYYLSTEFSRLYNAKILRNLGFTLSDIKSFFYEKNSLGQRESALEKIDALKEQIAQLEKKISVLEVLSDELSVVDSLRHNSDISESDAFWLVPIRLNYSYDTDEKALSTVRSFLENNEIPRYSYILKAEMKDGLPCTQRYIGYSVHGDLEKPTENAIFVPSRKAIRFSWSLIAGERFDDGMKRMDMYNRLREMGVLGSEVELYGHTINISTREGITYLNHISYIPLGGEPLVDWNAI